MNDLTNNNINNMIYHIRGKDVMLDSDLAKLYKYKNGAKTLNQIVQRNIDRFPNEFYFQLNIDECSRFQFGTLNKKRGYNIKYLPYVFTEQGVAMLSTVIKTETAVTVSIAIMNAFVSMRHFLNDNNDILNRITTTEYKLIDHDNKINYLINKFDDKKIASQKIFFNGEIYEAYDFILELFSRAKEAITIIDNYADKTMLEMAKKYQNIHFKIVTNMDNNYIDNNLLLKYKNEYHNLEVININIFHDRFIIIDNKELYLLGSSIKDMGKKCFGITIINDSEYLDRILKLI